MCEQSAEVSKCGKCGAEQVITWHICPYKAEINDDDETLCDCCDNCRAECQDNI
jgi:hypothetical protein